MTAIDPVSPSGIHSARLRASTVVVVPVIHAQVVIPMTSGIPRDNCVNTFNFLATTANAAAFTAIRTALTGFYGTTNTTWSARVDAPNVKLKLYDLSQPKPRPPVFDDLLGLGATVGTGSLPPELAICCSYQGGKIAGVAQARRRGRFYFGPLASAAISSDVVSSTTTANLANRLKTLCDACIADPAIEWIVYTSTAQNEASHAQVTNGWVDNAVDVQRRRGLTATSRSLWTKT